MILTEQQTPEQSEYSFLRNIINATIKNVFYTKDLLWQSHMKATHVWCTVHWRSIMKVISVPRPATEPSMKTLLNLVMGSSKHLECTGHLY